MGFLHPFGVLGEDGVFVVDAVDAFRVQHGGSDVTAQVLDRVTGGSLLGQLLADVAAEGDEGDLGGLGGAAGVLGGNARGSRCRLQGLEALGNEFVLALPGALRLEFHDGQTLATAHRGGHVFREGRDMLSIGKAAVADVLEVALLNVDVADHPVVVHHGHAVGGQVNVELAAPEAEFLRLADGGDGVLGIALPVAAVGDDLRLRDAVRAPGLDVIPAVEDAVDGIEGGESRLALVHQELDEDVVGLLAAVEDHLQVRGEGAEVGRKPVGGGLLDGIALAHAFQAQVADQAQVRPVVAEAQVGGLLDLAGDDGVGLADEGVDEFLGTGDADLAVQLGVALVQVGRQEVEFMEMDDVLEGEEAVHVVLDLERIRHAGAVVDGVLEIVGVRDEFPGLGGIREQGAVHGDRIPLERLAVLVQGLVGAGDEGVVLTAGDVGVELLAGVQVHVQIRLQGLQTGGEAVHRHDAARGGAGDGADVLAAVLEHLREAVVHPLGELCMLADAARSQAAVHAVMQLVEEGGLPQEGFAVRGQEALLIGLGQQVADLLVLRTAPVGTRSVTAVVADIERLVALGGRRVLHGVEFVGMGVERGAADVSPKVADHGRVLLGEG